MIKKEKGITLITLVITVVLLIIITGTLATKSMTNLQLSNLTRLQNDIEALNDRIAAYYVKCGELPYGRYKENSIQKSALESVLNDMSNNDGDVYYTIDLLELDNLSLNYGEGYESMSEDRYIMNQKSHVVYYIKGINYDGQKYHTVGSNPYIGN